MINPYIEQTEKLKILFKIPLKNFYKYKKYHIMVVDINIIDDKTSIIFIFFDVKTQLPLMYNPGMGPRIKEFCTDCNKIFYKVGLTDKYKNTYHHDMNIVYFEFIT